MAPGEIEIASESLFVRDGDAIVPTDHTRGPWDPGLMHGGPVAALLAHAMVDDASEPVHEPAAWFPARFTAELMRPLAIRPLRITTEVIRSGRRARLVAARLETDGKLVARAALQQIHTADVPVPTDGPARVWAAVPPSAPEDEPESTMRRLATEIAFHASSTEHRSTDGLILSVSAARDWIRVKLPLFPGEDLTPLERVVAAADFGNGVSASLPFERYTFVNADLTVHLFRLPVDEWVLLDAVTHAGDLGVGLAESALSDRLGLIGRSCQSLAIDRSVDRLAVGGARGDCPSRPSACGEPHAVIRGGVLGERQRARPDSAMSLPDQLAELQEAGEVVDVGVEEGDGGDDVGDAAPAPPAAPLRGWRPPGSCRKLSPTSCSTRSRLSGGTRASTGARRPSWRRRPRAAWRPPWPPRRGSRTAAPC